MARKEKLAKRETKGGSVATALHSLSAPTEKARRTEILDTAAELFASSGIRTSLQEIADACGIQAGSLYFHFESKEAIVIELVKRYQEQLNAAADQALDDLKREGVDRLLDRVTALAESVAKCAIENRAALLQTFYDPPADASEELVRLARRTPRSIDDAMLKILQAGQAAGKLRPGIDLRSLAEQICQSMLHVGVGQSHRVSGAERAPSLKCEFLLSGLSSKIPDFRKLDRSAAFAAAEKTIASWGTDEATGKESLLLATARSEFGRKGYEATTIRDISAASGMSTGTVYRLAGSKDALLGSIMGSYIKNVTTCWDAVIASKATPVEKLDALLWVDINVLDRFSDEFKIQLSWIRQVPPPTSSKFEELSSQFKYLKALLTEGESNGHFRSFEASAHIIAISLFELFWPSQHIVQRIGARAAHLLMREALLCGANQKR